MNNTDLFAHLLNQRVYNMPIRCDHCDLPLILAPVRAYRLSQGRRHMARRLLCWMGREEIAYRRAA